MDVNALKREQFSSDAEFNRVRNNLLLDIRSELRDTLRKNIVHNTSGKLRSLGLNVYADLYDDAINDISLIDTWVAGIDYDEA